MRCDHKIYLLYFYFCIVNLILPPPSGFFYHAHVLCCEDINRHYRLKVYTVSRWWCPYVCNDGYFEILASHLTFFTDAIMYRKNRYICSSSTCSMLSSVRKNIFKIHLRNSYVCFAKSVFSYAEKRFELCILNKPYFAILSTSGYYSSISPLKQK